MEEEEEEEEERLGVIGEEVEETDGGRVYV